MIATGLAAIMAALLWATVTYALGCCFLEWRNGRRQRRKLPRNLGPVDWQKVIDQAYADAVRDGRACECGGWYQKLPNGARICTDCFVTVADNDPRRY